jgi:hypothetical protein
MMLQVFRFSLYCCFFLLGFIYSNGASQASVITPISAHGWPNERTTDHTPGLAIDNLLTTYTWTTQAFNTNPASLGVKFSGLETVSRIRIYKDNDTGSPDDLVGRKDLLIQYTTGTNTDITLRTWTNVTGLTNGYLGNELLVATSVNSNGTVVGDYHDSPAGDGWGSLTFDPIQATGMRIYFSKTVGEQNTYMHYLVYEIQFYGLDNTAVPEPASVCIFSAISIGVFLSRKKSLRKILG